MPEITAEQNRKLGELYLQLRIVLGEQFTRIRFDACVAQYQRPSRIFHGLDHMLAMSEIKPKEASLLRTSEAASYSMVAGFFHDVEYPSIPEDPTPMTKLITDKYLDTSNGKKTLKDLEQGDTAGAIVYSIFGFKPGHELSPFPSKTNAGGMNEFYCALQAANELRAIGMNNTFITAIVAGIEATIPFRNPDRMNELRARVDKTNTDLNLHMTPQQIDEIMIAAVHTANKDVSGFLGGLNPLDSNARPTTESVLATIQGGDMLSPEEVAALRVDGNAPINAPGNYSPRDFLDARLKRAGLYHLVIPGEGGTIPNLFFETNLSNGIAYPPDGWAAKANKLAYDNNLPVRTAEYARLISAGIVNALAVLCADKPADVKVKDMVGGLATGMNESKLPTDASEVRRLAYACVAGPRANTEYDTPRSAISELIISKLGEHKIEALAKASRPLLMAPNPPDAEQAKANAKDFINIMGAALGNNLNTIRAKIADSTRAGDGNKALATRIDQAPIPQFTQIS